MHVACYRKYRLIVFKKDTVELIQISLVLFVGFSSVVYDKLDITTGSKNCEKVHRFFTGFSHIYTANL